MIPAGRRALLVGGLALALPWLPALPAASAAEPAVQVELVATGCPLSWEASIRRIARVEIGDLVLDAGQPAQPAQPAQPEKDRVVVECSDELVNLNLKRVGQPRSLDRQVRLDGYPAESRPRVIALAALELLASVSPEVRRRVETSPRPAPPAPTATTTAPPPDPTFSVLAAGVRRRFLADQGVDIWGGALLLRTDLRSGSRLGASLDLDVGGSHSTTAAGAISGLMASAGARLDLQVRAGMLQARAGLGARLGVVRLSGQPAGAAEVSGHSFVSPWAGPVAAGELVIAWRRACIALGLEAGLTVLGASGVRDASIVTTVGGPWLGLSLGVGTQTPIW